MNMLTIYFYADPDSNRCVQGVNVLFQDVDLVWLQDPLRFIAALFRSARTNGTRLVSFLSDDGARTTRYAPFFANSGFFYLTADPENVYFAYSVMTAFDILRATGSHQNVFTYRLMERMDLDMSGRGRGSGGSGRSGGPRHNNNSTTSSISGGGGDRNNNNNGGLQVDSVSSVSSAGQFKNRFMSLHQFPSGVKYHHDKAYMAKIHSRAVVPYIFHM